MKLVILGVDGGKSGNLRRQELAATDDFDEWVAVSIGSKPGRGADQFTIRVVTAAALARQGGDAVVIGEWPILVLDRFVYADLLDWLERVIRDCCADTWEASVDNLRRYFRWEYDAERQLRYTI